MDDDEPLTGSVLVLSEDGEIVGLHTGFAPAPANVVPHGERWLLGSLADQPVRVVPAPR
ncbi:hypothetical protein [Allonocardiopsis opalescens]|uniref:Uncharacterized protein n=1 Tax=Allonocardiopsis opalescens TaxID=1144618 RepID=A0A2T0Q4D7_9ACTN|nr:hypothetical protein [Allonocardiopsis opalescens]PRX98640.1 hypothetical protein CLV72_104218 [Allonocardiopsis opalescens]